MARSRTRMIAVGAVAALAVAGGGAALAATKLGDPKEESQKVVTEAAKELGVTPSALSDAIQKALKSRVDAAVAAGTLTEEQGAELKQKIESGEMPLFAGPGMGFRGHGGHHGGFGRHGGFGDHGGFAGLDEAADYLGVTEDELRAELEDGKSLADVAKAEGKSVDGLVDALVTASTKKIDAAVSAGRITEEQAASLKADLKSRITERVNGTRPEGMGRGPGPGHPWGHDQDDDDAGAPAFAPAGQGGATL
jgi:hypothetical protein